ncbi:hypothetical protein N7478_009084 [Penicillium angulare]|uniref:uncharacterized protein n=1 Tax=Penicillium angulare TaxID=116970 RepID=UPI0025416D09|nr:uncharacterized protein N7478_009084 [Penicillium angulare]KAJ5273959.1 hypothetical protein N7478_009084 [Penicillium angulare]
MLLSLPPELIQLILRSCEASAFLQAAYSCHALFNLASSSRDLVLFQLSQTPGDAGDWGPLTTKQLFQILLQRCQRQLFGVEYQYEGKMIEFKGKVLDTRASSFIHAEDAKHSLLVFKDDPTVYLVGIHNGVLSLQHRFNTPASKFGDVQILHTVFDDPEVYVLHRFRPNFDQDLDMSHPFVKRAIQSSPHGKIYLSCHRLDHGSSGVHEIAPESTIVEVYGFPEQNSHEPLSLAVHGDHFAISWQHMQHSHDHQVVLYTAQNSEDDEEKYDYLRTDANWKDQSAHIVVSKYSSCVLTDTTDNSDGDRESDGRGAPVKIAFNDEGQQLLYHYRAKTLYDSFHRLQWTPPVGQLYPPASENGCRVTFRSDLSLRFSIGIPFFGTHQAGDGTLGSRCRWRYFAVGIATHRIEHWSVACLLRSEAFPGFNRCGHELNLERGRRFNEWQIMAQLGGFQENSTSLGSLIAYSNQKTRVAMASWKTISVWALEPNLLIEGDDDGFYPESWQTPGGYPELRPAIIHLNAVCSQLQFTEKENELVAITDRGLMLLHLKPDGRSIQAFEKHEIDIPKSEG